MTTGSRQETWASRVVGLAAATCLALVASGAWAVVDDDCADVATAQYTACGAEATDDFYVAQALCLNGPDDDAQEAECLAEARAERTADRLLCTQQRVARNALCTSLGGGRYAPDFDPAHFDSDFEHLTRPNPWYPLRIGNHWEFAGSGEAVSIDVLDATKLVEGVTCLVVRDVVSVDGEVVEDTDDWFAHHKNGSVVYCGEEVKDYETFAGDEPAAPELVAIDGSFKAGRNGALPGTFFPGSPRVGDVYRQEWSPGNAEDAARVLSTTYGFGSNRELDRFVPRGLAELLCRGDCVVTLEFSPTEPTALARKYYARGIGQFLEVKPDTGGIVQLVDCNVDPKCNALPAP